MKASLICLVELISCYFKCIIYFHGASLSKSTEFRNSMPERVKSSDIYCRICLGSSDFEELISPCFCAGTIGIVHQRCLEKWLNLSRSSTCEICGCTFEVSKRYPHFCKWLWMGGNGVGTHRRRYLWTDLICLLIMVPLLILCAWLAISSNQDGANTNAKRFPWQSFFLGLLCSLLLLVFNIWLTFSLRYHHQSWKLWRKEQTYIVLSDAVKRKKVINIGFDPQNPASVMHCYKQERNQQVKQLNTTESNETVTRLNKTINDSELETNTIRQQFSNAENYSAPMRNIESEVCDELTNHRKDDSPMISNKMEILSTKEEMINEEECAANVCHTESIAS
ncbi:unnamed protein product [Schistosoma turkestanicum]|nr:unnamed protein product [Schistosoma turkestanicum]